MTTEIMPGFPRRLRAARLTAGFTNAAEAIEALGASGSTYRAAESGARTASRRLIEGAITVFGVSPAYLLEGRPETEVDQQAIRYERALECALQVNASRDRLARWLRQSRRARGYKTATQAAQMFSMPLSTYSSHESGSLSIPQERLAIYAVGFQADLLRIEEEDRAIKVGSAGFERTSNPGSSLETELLDTQRNTRRPSWILWDALSQESQTKGRSLLVPLLRIADDGSGPKLDAPLMLPTDFVDGREIQGELEERRVFCALLGDAHRKERTVVLVRPWSGERDMPLVMSDGKRVWEGNFHCELEEGDPLDPATFDGKIIVLGIRHARIMVEG